MADLTGMMQAAAGAAGGEGAFIEDVFSCFLYTGNGGTQTITNGIDLDGEGGLVWAKSRGAANSHILTDTVRGAANTLSTNSNAAQNAIESNSLSSFNSNGFSLNASARINALNDPTVSWTFRKAPKFFDVVTYTGTGANRTVAHNLGSVPGSIWVKRTSADGDWQVYHRANTAAPETDFLVLNSTAATVDSNTRWNDTLPTDTVFTVGTEATVNASGGTYVAYLFAHDDGGFGDDGTENVITCGSYTGNGSATGPVITLGYEPQWVLIKCTANPSGNGDWLLFDTMRGFNVSGGTQLLYANRSNAEGPASGQVSPTAIGFNINSSDTSVNASGETYIFIAIRRGPMKTPTAGTEVFAPVTVSSSGTFTSTANFPIDLIFYGARTITDKWYWFDRLRGNGALASNNATAEDAPYPTNFASNVNFQQTGITGDFSNYISYDLRRAPGYFDEVCYTGTGSATTFAHNLGVVPELMIMKKRSATDDWAVYAGDNTDFLQLNTTAATADDNTYWNDTSPTSSVFSVGTNADVNTSAATYVAYLFASLAGVQDIGTYTGNGTSLTVTTGFQPRFIMVKRTDSTGNWIVGDSTRGLVAGDDPALFLNTNTAETTDQDWVDVSATGFTVNETALNANVSTGVYLYWAIS